ncbi:hypothetical protein CPB85DRAFT_1442951 [Mucidula mucida]|nr:hypothetical protein CPB85DRAFT_1442951 [Mucidula mucida]
MLIRSKTWRCWVLYDRNWIVGVLPLLGIICGLISHALKMVTLFPSGSTTTSSLANKEWLIVYYAVTTSTNILTTSLIIYRILSVGGLKSAGTYRGIIKILVESAFLFSATYVVYLAVFAAAPTLIIGRVMAGEARFNDSWLYTTLPQSTGIRFATMHPAQTSATIDLLPRCENDLASDTSTPVNTGDASAVDVEKGMQLGGN